MKKGYGFNRYIVECKLLRKNGIKTDTKCFNRYIVECKLVKYVLRFQTCIPF